MKKYIFTLLLAIFFTLNLAYAETTYTIEIDEKIVATPTETNTVIESNQQKIEITPDETNAKNSEKNVVPEVAPTPPKKNYTDEDLYWLSRIVHAESSGESYEGKLAVANVVLNRMKSKSFPNTVKAVIFDKKYGVQFSPTKNGSIYKTPSQESIKAATAALEGTNNIQNALYFSNFSSHKSKSKKKYSFYKKIGNHTFYAY